MADAQRRSLDAYLVPQTGFKKGLVGLGSAFYDERLHRLRIETVHQLGQWGGMGEDDALGRRATPFPYVKPGVLPLVGHPAHEDGVILGPQFVAEHLGERRGEAGGMEVVVQKSVGRLGPFQNDIGAMERIDGKKTLVKLLTLLLQHTYRHVDARIAELADASALHLGKRVDASHHDTLDPLADDKIGTGWGLAIVGARLQAHVHGGPAEQRLVFGLDRGKGVHFGMSFAAAHVVPLADDATVAYNHRADHRVGLGVLPAVGCQLQTAAHVFDVFFFLIHFSVPYIFITFVAMTYTDLWQRLTAVYDAAEAKAIVKYVLDVRFGLSAADVYCGKVTQLSSDDTMALDKIIHRLAQAEPVQYVLGTASFAGHTFRVGPGVLIPRPETEELVAAVCQSVAAESPCGLSVLDVGTGSGCIAVSLALAFPGAHVTAWDISEAALAIARQNAEGLGADVRFARRDALHAPADEELWDVVVSNPPYICEQEREAMERNVLDYEPPTALFVPDADPLLFYRAIARYARTALRHGGGLYFEINPAYASGMRELLEQAGYERVEIRNDQFGKQRFAIAYRK